MGREKQKIDVELSRELSLFHITMMGVGMMIGAGVFVGTGISIGISGPGGMKKSATYLAGNTARIADQKS